MSFLNHENPLLTVMIRTGDPDYAVRTIYRVIPAGADAFATRTERLLHEAVRL